MRLLLLFLCQALASMDLSRVVVHSGSEEVNDVLEWMLFPTMARFSSDRAWGSHPDAKVELFFGLDLKNPAIQIQKCLSKKQSSLQQSSFVLTIDSETSTVRVSAFTKQGLLMGVGRFLREIKHMRVEDTCIVSVPTWRIRGHQYNFPCDLSPMDDRVEETIRALAVFGTNQIELAHLDWHTPNIFNDLAKVSSLCDRVGLNLTVWFTTDLWANQTAMTLMMNSMKRLDGLFLPSGDGGPQLAPAQFLALTKTIGAFGKQFHPNLEMWVSTQSYSAANFSTLMTLLEDPEVQTYLTGIVAGPHTRVTMSDLLDAVPPPFPVRDYPDLTHNLMAQFAVPEWPYAFAWTLGRQAINPLPKMEESIIRSRLAAPNASRLHGFGAYSEGLSDDVNKCLWSGLGLDASLAVEDVVAQYAHYFFDPLAESVIDMILGLEQSWKAPIETNKAILSTLTIAQAVEKDYNQSDWRLQTLLYRSYFDAYVQGRFLFEAENEHTAYFYLADATREGTIASMQKAERALNTTNDDPLLKSLRDRIVGLFGELEASIGSVKLQCQHEDLGVATMDVPLNEREFLLSQFTQIRQLMSEAQRLAAVNQLVQWENPGPGGMYDKLGDSDPKSRPHLQPGMGWTRDPENIHTPLQAFDDAFDAGLTSPPSRPITRTNWKLFAQMLFAEPLVMLYPVNPASHYQLDVVYFAEDPHLVANSHGAPLRLLLNNRTQIHPVIRPPFPMKVLSFAVPQNESATGLLEFRWFSDDDTAFGDGFGRGCQVSEVWLRVVA